VIPTDALTEYHPELAPPRITRISHIPARSAWEKTGSGGFGVAVTSFDTPLSPPAFTAVATKKYGIPLIRPGTLPPLVAPVTFVPVAIVTPGDVE
jgi:hypothetical protein